MIYTELHANETNSLRFIQKYCHLSIVVPLTDAIRQNLVSVHSQPVLTYAVWQIVGAKILLAVWRQFW